jgi:hypothetical protein
MWRRTLPTVAGRPTSIPTGGPGSGMPELRTGQGVPRSFADRQAKKRQPTPTARMPLFGTTKISRRSTPSTPAPHHPTRSSKAMHLPRFTLVRHQVDHACPLSAPRRRGLAGYPKATSVHSRAPRHRTIPWHQRHQRVIHSRVSLNLDGLSTCGKRTARAHGDPVRRCIVPGKAEEVSGGRGDDD